MAFKLASDHIGYQQIAVTDTVQRHKLGTIVKATDDNGGGEGEFIYLLGVASTVVGSWVTYNPDDFSTTLLVPNAHGPVAVAMSINVASQYGWYQIQGKGSAKAAVVADDAKVYIDTVAGHCDDAFVAGDRVFGAKWASASTAVGNLAEVELARPFTADGSS